MYMRPLGDIAQELPIVGRQYDGRLGSPECLGEFVNERDGEVVGGLV